MTTRAKASTLRLAELADLPVVLDIQGAARLLGISPDAGYDLVARDQFPAPVLRVGKAIRIPTLPLLAALGLSAEAAAAALGGDGAA